MSETPPTIPEIITKAILRAVPQVGSALAGIYDDLRERHAARISEFVEDVIDDIGEDKLATAIDSNEKLELMFLNSVNLASSTSYRVKRNLLSRVVKSAISDEASIDTSNLVFYALRNLDEPHIRALARLRHVEDMAILASKESSDESSDTVQRAVIDAGKREPIPVIAALIQAGVIEPAMLWGGGTAAGRITDFGRHLLGDLELDA